MLPNIFPKRRIRSRKGRDRLSTGLAAHIFGAVEGAMTEGKGHTQLLLDIITKTFAVKIFQMPEKNLREQEGPLGVHYQTKKWYVVDVPYPTILTMKRLDKLRLKSFVHVQEQLEIMRKIPHWWVMRNGLDI